MTVVCMMHANTRLHLVLMQRTMLLLLVEMVNDWAIQYGYSPVRDTMGAAVAGILTCGEGLACKRREEMKFAVASYGFTGYWY